MSVSTLDAGSHKGRNYAFRDAVLVHLHGAGIIEARPAPETRGLLLSEALRIPRGDVHGIEGWTIAVRNQARLDFSGAQDEVDREARANDDDLFASIQYRRGHPIAQAYVTTQLHVLPALIRATATSE